MSVIIALDLGGTQIRLAVYPKDGIDPIIIKKIPTIVENIEVFDRLSDLIETVWSVDSVDAISIAVPGPIDPVTDTVVAAGNIPGWDRFPLNKKLSQKYSTPILVGNDANLAAVGEWSYGAGRGHHHLLYLTVSTGIGGGVIIADKLLEGARGLAAELGHITVMSDGPICSCGAKGHLEAISSGTAIAQYISEQIALGHNSELSMNQKQTAKLAYTAARNGDKLAIEAFTRAGYYFGQALAGFLHIFNPSIVIIGGGVSQSGDLFFSPMYKSLRESLMDSAYLDLDNVPIVPPQLGDDAGLLGALAQARIYLEKREYDRLVK
jgi:glucokinase